MTRDEDEKTYQRDANADGDEQDHTSAPHHHFADVRFLDAGEVAEGVFAQAGQGEERVHVVLMGCERVDGDGEREDQLTQKVNLGASEG